MNTIEQGMQVRTNDGLIGTVISVMRSITHVRPTNLYVVTFLNRTVATYTRNEITPVFQRRSTDY